MLDGAVHRDAAVRVPLATLNRHGLIAGATGTGKTKTLQLMAEQLSAAGVPVFVADVKGDVSGLSVAGDPGGPAEKRMADLGLPFAPAAFPVEFLALGGLGPGVPVRANVTDFGPQLLGKVLGANETQEASLALVFHYADTKGLPLVDLADLRALLDVPRLRRGQGRAQGHRRAVEPDGRRAAALARRASRRAAGRSSSASRSSTSPTSCAPRRTAAGSSRASSSPRSRTSPCCGRRRSCGSSPSCSSRSPRPATCPSRSSSFFLDEAHLLFADATKAFLESVARTVRLIRSKGVGVFFVTQQPTDIPDEVLGQLGARVQHALRAFTPERREGPARDGLDVSALGRSTTSRRC